MMNAFEIRTQQGRLLRQYFETADVQTVVAQIEQEFQSEPWYQVNHHLCGHDDGLPCEPWVTLTQKGNVPVE